MILRLHRLSSTLVATTLALVAAPPPAMPWGCLGHRTVALIAEKHLSPNALAKARTLLTHHPIDPKLSRFCQPRSRDVFADASTWADDVKGDWQSPWHVTGPWHFLDVPRGAARDEVSSFCPAEGCVTKAISDQLDVLRSRTAAADKRVDALRFVIHFVGDVHQPLHCATNSDRGGNCVPVIYFRKAPRLQGGKYTPNLHAVWDTDIIERAARRETLQQFANGLDARFLSQMAVWQVGSVDDWAWESHQLAEQAAYGKLPTPIAVEPRQPPIENCTANNNIGRRMLKLHEAARQPYQKAATPEIEEQLAKAGARLAMVLNQVWP